MQRLFGLHPCNKECFECMLELVYLICFSSCVGLKVAVKRIIGGKWGACSGQACIGVDYVLVEDKFKSNLVTMLRFIN
jgi:hypothetical protein